MAWLYDELIGDLDMMEDKVDNPSPQSTPQVLPSFEAYTPPVTYSEEVEKTIGIPMEVEPLDHMKLEDLSLNTSTHDLFLSSRGFPSVDEPEPQLLPNFSPLCNTPKSGLQRNVEYPRVLLHRSMAQDMRTTTKCVV
ncbi:hypothetical protein Tco_0496260 [Tanacetum coccineum]